MTFNPCCCITCRTGGKIIGVMDLVFGVLGILFAGFTYVGISHIQSIEDQVVKEHFMIELKKGLKGHPEYENADDETIFSLMYIFMVAVLVGSLINLILGIFLVHGLRKNIPGFIQAYLIANGILLALAIVASVFGKLLFTLTGITIFLYVLSLYFMVVVYVAYMEVVENRNRSENGLSPAVKYEHA